VILSHINGFSDVVCVAGLWFYPTLQFFWCCLCSWIVILSHIKGFSDVVCVAGLWFYPTLQFFWCCLCSWIVVLSYITVFLMSFVSLDCDFILHYSFSDVVCLAGLLFYPTLQFCWCCLCSWIVILSHINGFSDVVCVVGLWFYPTLQFFWFRLCSWIVILSYITVFLMLFA
jgi:hypothetical protein